MFEKSRQTIQSITAALKTYRLGLVQAKAYRALKHHTTLKLKPYSLSTVEWAFLGMLFDLKDGIKASEAAEALGVEASFVTQIRERMVEKKLVEQRTGKDDKRQRVLHLTEKGRLLVPEIEHYMRAESRYLVDGLTAREILIYHKVLQTIVDNYMKSKEKS